MAQKSATVAVIKDNKLLLLLRGPTAPYNPNKYGFPGGMVDANESLEECVIRELYEETSIVANKNKLTSLVLQYDSGHKRTLFILQDNTVNSLVNISWEHSEYVWATYDDCSSMILVPGVAFAVNTLRDLKYVI